MKAGDTDASPENNNSLKNTFLTSQKPKAASDRHQSTRHNMDMGTVSTAETASVSSSRFSVLTRPIRTTPRKRAVVIGINYASHPHVRLQGCVNDAYIFAITLTKLLDFEPHEILFLIDSKPSPEYATPSNGFDGLPDIFQFPTRINILLALNWLTYDTCPGDVLLFYFAGHGIQLDDMSGWEGEGYDEAIVPVDFYLGAEIHGITTVMIRRILLNVVSHVHLTVILDTNGGQSLMGASSTGSRWYYIKGVKMKGLWPFITDGTDKVCRAVYNSAVWKHADMARKHVRPRFIPGSDVNSAESLFDPQLSKPSTPMVGRVKAFLLAAAPWGQCAVEALLPSFNISSLKKSRKYGEMQLFRNKEHTCHGVFTWSLVWALHTSINKSCSGPRQPLVSYLQLIQQLNANVQHCKTVHKLSRLDQRPELTVYLNSYRSFTDNIISSRSMETVKKKSTKSDFPVIHHKIPIFLGCPIFLSTIEAEIDLRNQCSIKRRADPAFERQKRAEESMISKRMSTMSIAKVKAKIEDGALACS